METDVGAAGIVGSLVHLRQFKQGPVQGLSRARLKNKSHVSSTEQGYRRLWAGLEECMMHGKANKVIVDWVGLSS